MHCRQRHHHRRHHHRRRWLGRTAVGLGDEEVVLIELLKVAVAATDRREVVVEHVRPLELVVHLQTFFIKLIK
jgi:hypothetical protein